MHLLFPGYALLGLALLIPGDPGRAAEPTPDSSDFRPALPVIPATLFDPRRFGAAGDGITVDTPAIQAAINAAASAGGGVVSFSRGTYLCGPLALASRINLHLGKGAVLTMLPMDRYPGGRVTPANFIRGADVHDVAISGPGRIEGQGQAWWPFAKTSGTKRPIMISLSHCERILIEQVTLKDSPMFHIAIGGNSAQITVRNVTIRAPASTDPVTPSHNTDACDISGHDALIENCDVSVGDDDFTCGGGTHDIRIVHCTYGYGHGVSIGSYTNGEVCNIVVTDCTFDRTECGIRIKSDRDRGGHVHHLRYENLRMTDVDFPILIYCAYLAKEREFRDLTHVGPDQAARYPSKPIGTKTPRFEDITFRSITATVSRGHRAGLVWGLPESPVKDILLQGVSIKADLPFGLYFANGVTLVDSSITTPEGITPLSCFHAQVETRQNK